MIATPIGNRRVGDVERPEVIRPPVDVDEIDDRAGDDAVDQVAGGAADDQRQADPRHAADDARGSPRTAPTPMSAAVAMTAISTVLNGKSARVQDAERRAGVPHVREVEKPGMTVTLSCSGSVARTIALVDLIERRR